MTSLGITLLSNSRELENLGFTDTVTVLMLITQQMGKFLFLNLPEKELRYLRTILICYSAPISRSNSAYRYAVRTISSEHINRYVLRFGV